MQTTVQTTVGATRFEGTVGRLAQTSQTARAVEVAQEVGQLPALALLFGELPNELGAIDVGLHRLEDQALELGRFVLVMTDISSCGMASLAGRVRRRRFGGAPLSKQ